MSIDVYELATQLIGPIEPVGESHTDEKRHQNLQRMINLTDSLVTDIDRVAHGFKNNHQASMKHSSVMASEFFDRMGISNE